MQNQENSPFYITCSQEHTELIVTPCRFLYAVAVGELVAVPLLVNFYRVYEVNDLQVTEDLTLGNGEAFHEGEDRRVLLLCHEGIRVEQPYDLLRNACGLFLQAVPRSNRRLNVFKQFSLCSFCASPWRRVGTHP